MDGAASSRRLKRDCVPASSRRTPVRHLRSVLPSLHILRILRSLARRVTESRSSGRSWSRPNSSSKCESRGAASRRRPTPASPKMASGYKSGPIAKSDPVSSTIPTNAESKGRLRCVAALWSSVDGRMSSRCSRGCRRTKGCERWAERRTSKTATLFVREQQTSAVLAKERT